MGLNQFRYMQYFVYNEVKADVDNGIMATNQNIGDYWVGIDTAYDKLNAKMDLSEDDVARRTIVESAYRKSSQKDKECKGESE